MPDGGFKDLPRRRPSSKVLYDKAFNIAENPKYYGYHRELASTFYKCFTKILQLQLLKENFFLSQELTEELHKPIIRKFVKRKVYSPLKYIIWGAALVDMQ